MENFAMNDLVNLVMESTSRETCIEKMPLLLVKIALFERVSEQIKIIKKEIELATNIIGEFKNEYFEIKEKESKKTIIKATNLDCAISEIEQNINSLTNEQKEIFTQLKSNVEEEKKQAVVSKTKEKLNLLKAINPSKAKQIVEIEVTKSLVLKETKNLLQEIEKKENFGKGDIC